MEKGETLLGALRREILEETGLEVEPGPLVEVVEILEGDGHFVVLDYACEVLGGEARAGDDARAVAWAGPDELEALGVTPAVLRVVLAALAALAARRAPRRG